MALTDDQIAWLQRNRSMSGSSAATVATSPPASSPAASDAGGDADALTAGQDGTLSAAPGEVGAEDALEVGGVPLDLPIAGEVWVANSGGRPIVFERATINADAEWGVVGRREVLDPGSVMLTADFRAKSIAALGVGGNFVISSGPDETSAVFTMTVNFAARWPAGNKAKNTISVTIDNETAIQMYNAEYRGNYVFALEVMTLSAPAMPNEPDQPEVTPRAEGGGPPPTTPAIGAHSDEGIEETEETKD